MSTIQDFMGVGMPKEQASRLGNTPITQAGAGTANTTATQIQGTLTYATTAGGATAFILPAGASLGRQFMFFNSTATTALVFPTIGGNFNGGSTDASFSVAQNKFVFFVRVSVNNWVSNLTA